MPPTVRRGEGPQHGNVGLDEVLRVAHALRVRASDLLALAPLEKR